jgi:hypothetical protein
MNRKAMPQFNLERRLPVQKMSNVTIPEILTELRFYQNWLSDLTATA